MKLRRAIAALGTVFALSFGLMLAPSQADAATLTINPRVNAVEAGQVLAAPDGSVFTITVFDTGLATGQKPVTHAFQTGDTLRQTANKIVQAINADTELQAIGVTATLQNGANYTIVSTSTNGTVYRQTTTGGGSNRLAIRQTLTIGGTVTVDDKLTLTIYDVGLEGGKELVVYKPNSGDTLADIVIRLRNKINNSTTLAALGISAKVSSVDSNTLLIESPTFETTQKFTSYSAKVKAGGTETMTLGSFLQTNGAQTITVAGPVVVGETVQFTVFNVDLPGSLKTVSYVTQAGDNLNQIRCGLRTEVNNDADLAEVGIHATCGGGVLTLASNSDEQTFYRESTVIGVDCAPITTSLTLFPRDRARLCISTVTPVGFPQFQNIMLQTLITIGQSGTDAAFRLAISDSTWFQFTNHNDYFLVRESNPKPADAPRFYEDDDAFFTADLAGITVTQPISGASTVYSSAIFENTSPTGGMRTESVSHVTAHETGHHLDSIYNGGNIDGYSKTATFQAALTRDLTGMNAANACTIEISDPALPGEPPVLYDGIFTNMLDSHGNYICGAPGNAGRTPIYGGSNVEIAQQAWPRLYPNLARG
ncbi:MAG TPA: hypothetical protein EYN91_06510 [Candidatus Melainabacteria bacterium]|nr:hypothetical protein [Candidatus Melainabacteria bacterium]HIN65034.1 hypothetical protein [Candidatus Obscuribacterales bacterium]